MTPAPVRLGSPERPRAAAAGGGLRDLLGPQVRSTVRAAIGDNPRSICLIDAPTHSNVGDHAILIGELDLLAKEYPHARISSFDILSYSPAADAVIERADVLLIHGGGNFGDLYPAHQDLRLRIFEQFPHKRIVQLPQSIHFGDGEYLERNRVALSRHKHLTLLVRDRVSEAFARNHFECDIQLCPDMAFAMDPIRPHEPTEDFFCLLRTDKEAVADHPSILRLLADHGSVRAADWLESERRIGYRIDRKLGELTYRSPKTMQLVGTSQLAIRRWVATSHVERGVKLLSSGARVVTDRLHAHIIGSLLGLPTIVFNSYDGKIAAFYDTWSWQDKNARLVRSMSDFADALQAPAHS